MMGDLKGFFQAFKTLFQWRKRNAQAEMFTLEPGRAEAQKGSAARKYINRGGCFD